MNGTAIVGDKCLTSTGVPWYLDTFVCKFFLLSTAGGREKREQETNDLLPSSCLCGVGPGCGQNCLLDGSSGASVELVFNSLSWE